MFKHIQNIGNWIRSAQGFWILAGSLVTSVFLYLYSLYEKLGWLEKTTLIFAIICLITLTILFIIELKEILFSKKEAIPLLDVFKKAHKYGWNFDIDGGHQILDFVAALKHYGFRGEIIFEGRLNEYNSEELLRTNLLREIPREHWGKYEIDWINTCKFNKDNNSHEFIDDNFFFTTYRIADVRNENFNDACGFNDVHVKGINRKWMKKALKKFQGNYLEQATRRDEVRKTLEILQRKQEEEEEDN
tara:strand:- start:379 stop:1116 length:738 start_codon:yes stop_codon:yes gene_type:complete